LQNKLRKVPHFSYVAVLERLVNARDDVLAGALEVVTTAQDLVPDTAGCCHMYHWNSGSTIVFRRLASGECIGSSASAIVVAPVTLTG
jgi:hypothetical protein